MPKVKECYCTIIIELATEDKEKKFVNIVIARNVNDEANHVKSKKVVGAGLVRRGGPV